MEDSWRIYGGFMEDLWKIYGEFMEYDSIVEHQFY
jgi:hypothetical protein